MVDVFLLGAPRWGEGERGIMAMGTSWGLLRGVRHKPPRTFRSRCGNCNLPGFVQGFRPVLYSLAGVLPV